MVFVPIKIRYGTKEQDIKETFIWDLPLDCVALSSHPGINPFTFSEIYCQMNNLPLKLCLKKIAQQIYKQLAHYQSVIKTIQNRFSLKEVPDNVRHIELKKYSKLFTIQINIQRKEFVYQDQFHWEANLARLFPPNEIEKIISEKNFNSNKSIPNSVIGSENPIITDQISKLDLGTIDFVDKLVSEMNLPSFFQPLILFDIIDQTWQQYELIATAQVPLTAAPSIFPPQTMEIELEMTPEEKQAAEEQMQDDFAPTKKDVEIDEGTIFRFLTVKDFLEPLSKKKGSITSSGSASSSFASAFSISPQKPSSAAAQQQQNNAQQQQQGLQQQMPYDQNQVIQEYLQEWGPRLWKLNEENMKLLEKKEGETRGRKRKIRAK